MKEDKEEGEGEEGEEEGENKEEEEEGEGEVGDLQAEIRGTRSKFASKKTFTSSSASCIYFEVTPSIFISLSARSFSGFVFFLSFFLSSFLFFSFPFFLSFFLSLFLPIFLSFSFHLVLLNPAKAPVRFISSIV